MPHIPWLSTLFVVFSFICTTIAATPIEAEVGRVAGFLGGMPDYQSDYLTSRFCYCKQPESKEGFKDEGHYYQFEYYNKHLNATYILEHVCMTNHDSSINCFQIEANAFTTEWPMGMWNKKFCREWQKNDSLMMGKKDKLCYTPHCDVNHGPDVIKWNKQKRKLDQAGGQGRADQNQAKTNAECEAMCLDHTGMPIAEYERLGQSHTYLYEDLDDMCNQCQ